MKNDKIVNAWNEIESDDITKKEILNDIIKRQKKQAKRLRKRKMAVIIAAIPLTLVLLCAAAIIVYEAVVFYDMDGNIQEVTDISHTRYEPGTEEYDFEEELRNSREDNAIIFIFYEDADTQFPSINTIPAIKKIDDYEELKNYLQNNGGEEFKLPEYIPAGFDFEYASVSLGLSETTDYEEFEPVYREEKFGNVYEKYLLPENQTRVESVTVSYTNGKIYLSCNASLSKGSLAFGTTVEVNTEPEVIDIPQFDRSLIMSYKNGSLNPRPMWTIKAERSIDEPACVLDTLFISKTLREMQSARFNNKMYIKNFGIKEYDMVNYWINATSTLFSGVSRNEIIKVANSIK